MFRAVICTRRLYGYHSILALTSICKRLCNAITVAAFSSLLIAIQSGQSHRISVVALQFAHTSTNSTLPWDCRQLSLYLCSRHRRAPSIQTHHCDISVCPSFWWRGTHVRVFEPQYCKCSRVCTSSAPPFHMCSVLFRISSVVAAFQEYCLDRPHDCSRS